MSTSSEPQLPAVPNLRAWTKTLVAQYSVRAGERMGQHFLIDRGVLQAIMRAAAIVPGAPVLEVGGGFGVLTLELLKAQARVTVVELDRRLSEALQKIALAGGNLTVLEGDIIKVSEDALRTALGLSGDDQFSIVANLPYEISGAFLRRFLGGSFRPVAMVLLLQREVAERLKAAPGETSLLSLSAQLACQEVVLVRPVHPQSFWPPPRVESAIVRFTLRTPAERAALLGGLAEPELWRVAHIGFAARRKLLLNNLSSAYAAERPLLEQALVTAGLTPLARAQELSLSQWIALSAALTNLPLKASADVLTA